MKRPDFFIIGAPKCGTTSLASWLGQNPQVYFSPLKEPHFFNSNHRGPRISELWRYEALFEDAGPTHRAVGEGSVTYLYSPDAIRKIEEYTEGKAKYIVCLRNPVEMAPSLHGQLYFDNDEHIADFATAWRLNELRERGEMIGRACRGPQYLAYRNICELGAHLKRLYRSVPRNRVCPVLFDDMKRDPRTVYLAALEFLGVDYDGKQAFAAENMAKQTRMRVLSRVPQLMHFIKIRLRIKQNFGLSRALVRANVKTISRAPLSAELRESIVQHCRDDILLLERLLSRDLSHWMAPDSAG